MSDQSERSQIENRYPSIINPNGVYADIFPINNPFQFGGTEIELIQKTKESLRGYLDHEDLNFYYFGKRDNNKSAFTINLFQPNKLLQFDLEWDVHFDLVDNLMLRLFHLIEPVQHDINTVNEINMITFLKSNNIRINNISTFCLPTEFSGKDIDDLSKYGNSFVYHFIPKQGVSYDKLRGQHLDEPRLINKNFEDYQDRTKMLTYYKFENEQIFTLQEPTSFKFERKRFSNK